MRKIILHCIAVRTLFELSAEVYKYSKNNKTFCKCIQVWNSEIHNFFDFQISLTYSAGSLYQGTSMGTHILMPKKRNIPFVTLTFFITGYFFLLTLI